MAEITAKYVKVQAPVPTVVNQMAANGTYYKPVALPVDMIKRLLEQNAVVKEVISEEDEDTGETTVTEVALTLDDYTADNGGTIPEGVTVVTDIDAEIEAAHEEEAEAKLVELGEAIKAKQEETAQEFLGTDTITGGGQDAQGGIPNPPPIPDGPTGTGSDPIVEPEEQP